MTNMLGTPPVEAVLSRMFAAAAAQDRAGPPLMPPGTTYETATVAEMVEAYQDRYIPVSSQAGQLLYALARASRPDTIVEFGLSFGVSTIYLAAAVTDNGSGRVVTTELNLKKIEAARANLEEAGVSEVVTILPGDALETLTDVPGPVGMVLLDGWKSLCLPVLRLLEPKLAPGALIAADDSSFPDMADYLAYVRDPANGYVSASFPVEDGVELSSWTGR
jgi:predicted O-methyltransferase YrrM